MRLILVLIGFVLSAAAQQVSSKSFPYPSASVAGTVDPKLHADVVTLIELDAAKQRLQNNFKQSVDVGKKQMMQACPNCSPAFGDEWARQMLTRLNIDDFVQVAIRTYEKYLNDEEVKQLIALVKAKKASRPANISPELKQKLTSAMPSIQSEIMGGCVQIASKLGSQIGQKIEKEHPEYLKAPSKSSKE